MLDHAKQIELELNAANGRIAELTTKTPPHECPQESVASLAANHPCLAEYLASLESRIAKGDADIQRLQEVVFKERQGASLSSDTVTAAIEIMVERRKQFERRVEICEKDHVLKFDFDKQVENSAKMLGMATDLNLDLQNKADMWRDEFERIKTICYGKSLEFLEIQGICERAMLDIRSQISLIDQREKVAEENIDLRRELRVISDHYDILRAELVESHAKIMHGMFQAAAMSKDMDYCRTMSNAKLRGKCLACDGKGLVGSPATQTHDAESECCQHCEGCGYVEIPDPSWLKDGKIQFNLLPKEHPDYDPTIE